LKIQRAKCKVQYVIAASCLYVFSQALVFASIPKAYGFEAATHFQLTLLGGSLISIVIYRDGDGFSLAKHMLTAIPQFLSFEF